MSNERSSLITLGSVNKQLMYPIYMGVSHILISMATTIMRKHEFNNHPLFLNFLMFLGEFFIGFLFIIELKLSESIMNKKRRKIPKKTIGVIIGYIFLCFFIDFVASFALEMIRESKNTSFLELIFKLVEMGFIAVLSRYILHVKYYKHHVVGYSILVIGLGVYGIIEIYEKIGNLNIKILTALLLLTVYLVSSFLEIIEKYLMDVEYVSPYLIISGEGFFGLIFFIN